MSTSLARKWISLIRSLLFPAYNKTKSGFIEHLMEHPISVTPIKSLRYVEICDKF